MNNTLEYHIEDGQQRITAFFIIVHRIKVCLEEIDKGPSVPPRSYSNCSSIKREHFICG
jgi:uncharacterized protein with ParB-like and HNH nuclease domain